MYIWLFWASRCATSLSLSPHQVDHKTKVKWILPTNWSSLSQVKVVVFFACWCFPLFECRTIFYMVQHEVLWCVGVACLKASLFTKIWCSLHAKRYRHPWILCETIIILIECKTTTYRPHVESFQFPFILTRIRANYISSKTDPDQKIAGCKLWPQGKNRQPS